MKTYIGECSIFRGFIDYEGSKSPFFYDCEKSILYIIPSSVEKLKENKQEMYNEFAKSFIKENDNEWIPNNYINGYTEYDTGIIFQTKGEKNNINGFIQYKVNSVFEYNYGKKDFDGISGLLFESPELNCFYDASSIYKHKKDKDGKRIIIESEFRESKEIASFMYEDIQVKVDIKIDRTFCYRVENPLQAKTKLMFTFSKKVKEMSKILEIIMIQNKFMQFITYRRNVKFEKVRTLDINEDKKKEIKGIIIYNELMDNEVETNKNRRQRIIKLSDIEEVVSKMYELIANGDIYFSHLCKNISSLSSYNIMRVSRIFAEFERTYKQVYGESIRSKEYSDTKEEIANELNKIKENQIGQKKRYYKQIIRGIEKSSIGLGQKVEYALKDCSTIMNKVINIYYQKHEKIENISDRLGMLRNDIIHGEMQYKLKPIDLTDINMLEILIYVVIFKFIDLTDKNIQSCINDIFRMHIQ